MFVTAKLNLVSGMVIGAAAVMIMKQIEKYSVLPEAYMEQDSVHSNFIILKKV